MSRLCRLKTKTYGEDGQLAYEEITKLREQVAAQAAVIEKLLTFVKYVAEQTPEKPDYWSSCGQCSSNSDEAEDLLAIPTDSTQILDEVRRAEREKCAKVCESHPDPEYTAVHLECARRILEME